MKLIVFVPLTLPSFSPCASRPNSFAADFFHISLCLGFCISWRYFRYSPVSGSYTSWILSVGLGWLVFIRFLCEILTLLLFADRKYSFKRALSGVCSAAVFCDFSLVSIGLSIVAVALDCLFVLTLGVGVSLATLGVGVVSTTLGFGMSLATLGAAGCVSCGGLAVDSKVTVLCRSVVVASVGMLLRTSLIRCSASISSMPFLFLRSFSACVRSLSAFTIVSSVVKVGSVMYLCLKCTVSVILSLRVFLE